MPPERDSRGRFVKKGQGSPGFVGVDIDVTIDTEKIRRAEEEARFRNFGHAAARIRLDAQASIIPDPLGKPSPPGQPPATKKGQLRRAIRYAVDRFGAIVGASANVVGTSASAHELGGPYKGADYDERAFMGPALLQNIDRFGGSWRGSIGEGGGGAFTEVRA